MVFPSHGIHFFCCAEHVTFLSSYSECRDPVPQAASSVPVPCSVHSARYDRGMGCSMRFARCHYWKKIASLAEPRTGPAYCKVCCSEIVKESPGKALGLWELTSVHVPGGDSLAGAGWQMLQSSAFRAMENLCCGFQLHLFQAPVSASHEHALFLSTCGAFNVLMP